MDIISHALLTNLVFKDAPTEQRLLATFFGIMPDLISFGGLFNMNFVRKLFFYKHPPMSVYPRYVMILYKAFHSLVIWLIVFLFLLLLDLKWWAIAICGWGLHIVIDIFTHSKRAFPTKILWPFSDFFFSGLSWSNKWFMLFNYLMILFLYIFFYF